MCILSPFIWKCRCVLLLCLSSVPPFTNAPLEPELCRVGVLSVQFTVGSLHLEERVPGTRASLGIAGWGSEWRVRMWSCGDHSLPRGFFEFDRGRDSCWEHFFILNNPCPLTFTSTYRQDWRNFSSDCSSLISAFMFLLIYFPLFPLV